MIMLLKNQGIIEDIEDKEDKEREIEDDKDKQKLL